MSNANHWNTIYTNTPEDQLGWYETDLIPTLQLLEKAQTLTHQHVLVAGAGSTTLVDRLIEKDFANLTATDISRSALEILSHRLQTKNLRIDFVEDDLTQPTQLLNLAPVDLWIDRAVLHFMGDQKDRDAYANLLNQKMTKGGHVILAEYTMTCPAKCAGLPVLRYDLDGLKRFLGADFELMDWFFYDYTQPSGGKRAYIYALFQKR